MLKVRYHKSSLEFKGANKYMQLLTQKKFKFYDKKGVLLRAPETEIVSCSIDSCDVHCEINQNDSFQ